MMLASRVRLLPPNQVYFTDEVASMLGMTVQQFRRRRKELENAGMPSPILTGKAMRFPRRPIDEWLNDPKRPAGYRAANDVLPTHFRTLQQHRDELAQTYGEPKPRKNKDK